MRVRIRLSAAQRSAIECRMHGAEQVDGLVVDGCYLIVTDRVATARALAHAANAEADSAEFDAAPDAVYARRAARSLEAVWWKVERLEAP